MNPLRRGVFWVTDIDSPEMIILSAECDIQGNFLTQPVPELLADNGCEFNHKRVWETFKRSEKYNYYPRGRVQIRHGKAAIYCNPVLCTDNVIAKVTPAFGLFTENGITSVRVVADGSEHYKYSAEL